jgi:hypothetical protein
MRVTLEEKRRRDREIALEDGVSANIFYPIVCSDLSHVAEYVRAQRREEEELDIDRE